MILNLHCRRFLLVAVIGATMVALFGCTPPTPFGIVFISNRDGNDEIYRMTSDGQNVERLTHTPDINEQVAVVSPDGRKILFDRGGVRLEREVYSLDVSNGNVSQLTDAPAYNLAGAWSPDGKQVAFISDRDGGAYRLYLMNPDGTDQKHVPLITDSERDVINAAWSPDSRYIVYETREHIRAQEVLTPTLFIVDLTTSEVRRLTNDNLGACEAPSWSSDGEWIAMVCTKGISAGDYGEIYTVHPDGTALKQVTTRPADYKPSLPQNSFRTWIGNPHWSPDGRQIVYLAAVNGPWNIYIMDADGKNNRRLTDHNMADWSISTYRLP